MSIQKWETLSTEYLFRDTWFTVRKDTCKTAEGKIISPYYVYEFPTWVTGFALTEDGKVILVRQYRHAIEDIILEIPGGCVDQTDASFEEAVRRELLEETGYSFTSAEYLGKISPNPSTNTNWMHMFLLRGGKKTHELDLDHNEDIEVELVTVDELKTLLKQNKILQALHVTTIMYALNALDEITL